jgi:hypothetical protein
MPGLVSADFLKRFLSSSEFALRDQDIGNAVQSGDTQMMVTIDLGERGLGLTQCLTESTHRMQNLSTVN